MYWLPFLLYASTSLDAAFINNQNANATSRYANLGTSPPSEAPVAYKRFQPSPEIQLCGTDLANKVKEICSIWTFIAKGMQTSRMPNLQCTSFHLF